MGDGNDIALLKLDRKAKGLDATPSRIGRRYHHCWKIAGGYGMGDDGIEQQYCKEPPNVTDAGSWICAGGRGEDACTGNVPHRFCIVCRPAIHTRLAATGDSGGPLLLADSPKRYIEKGNPRFDMIVGITSDGYGDDEPGQCSGFEPAIDTSVDYFRNWIENTIECRPKVDLILSSTTCNTVIT